jgi:hypothetical protein
VKPDSWFIKKPSHTFPVCCFCLCCVAFNLSLSGLLSCSLSLSLSGLFFFMTCDDICFLLPSFLVFF